MKRSQMALCAMLAVSASAWAGGDTQFYLHGGDKVVFYGDSITEQRMYSNILETFVATRYPDLNVAFVNSGWGGDTVHGGGGGTIDTRLNRDVFPVSANRGHDPARHERWRLSRRKRGE